MELRSRSVKSQTPEQLLKNRPVDYFPTVSETEQFYTSTQPVLKSPEVHAPRTEIGQKRQSNAERDESSSSSSSSKKLRVGGNAGQDGDSDNVHVTDVSGAEEYDQTLVIDLSPKEEVLTLSDEEVQTINQQVINVVGTITDDNFICTLCIAELAGKRNVQKHLQAAEHNRRVVTMKRGHDANFFCQMCYVSCKTKEMYEQHLAGRRHQRSIQVTNKWNKQGSKPRPIGVILEGMLKPDTVAATGDGLSLGVSPSMLAFFKMPGPFIGLQYAEEVGVRDDTHPTYTCTLCKVSVDVGNASLHFTSTAHRVTVLKKDYPEKYSQLLQHSANEGRKGAEFHAKIKALVADIERTEGRKVELIKRRILVKTSGKTRRNTTPRRGAPSFRRGGYRGSPFPASSSWMGPPGPPASQYNPVQHPPHNFLPGQRGRGRGGREAGQRGRGRGRGGWNRYHDDFHSSDHQGGGRRYEEHTNTPPVGYSSGDFQNAFIQEKNEFPSGMGGTSYTHTSPSSISRSPGFQPHPTTFRGLPPRESGAALSTSFHSPQLSLKTGNPPYSQQVTPQPTGIGSPQLDRVQPGTFQPYQQVLPSQAISSKFDMMPRGTAQQATHLQTSPQLGITQPANFHPSYQLATPLPTANASPQLGRMRPGSHQQATPQHPALTSPQVPLPVQQHLAPSDHPPQKAQENKVQAQLGVLSNIQSEEEAEAALSLSSALTQALLAYRLRNTTADTPLSSLLSVMQKTAAIPPSSTSN